MDKEAHGEEEESGEGTLHRDRSTQHAWAGEGSLPGDDESQFWWEKAEM